MFRPGLGLLILSSDEYLKTPNEPAGNLDPPRFGVSPAFALPFRDCGFLKEAREVFLELLLLLTLPSLTSFSLSPASLFHRPNPLGFGDVRTFSVQCKFLPPAVPGFGGNLL